MAESIREAKAADDLLAAGSLQEAYGLYCQWWDSRRFRLTDALDFPSLVFVIINMSRAASTPKEMFQVVTKTNQLIKACDKALTEKVSLYIILATLQLRLNQYNDAAGHLQRALLLDYPWNRPFKPWPRLSREPQHLVFHCVLHGP